MRPFWIVGVIVAGLAVWGATAFAKSPKFSVARIDVTGTKRASSSDVIARAAIDRHENIWLLDVRGVEDRVAAVPYVASARVHRQFPADVRIDVIERAPVACVRFASGDAVTVDDQNRALQADCIEGLVAYAVRANDAPPPGAFIHDAELTELEGDAHVLMPGGQHFAAFSHDKYEQLVATLPGGITVQFGDDDELGRKERLVGPILAQLGPKAERVTSLDIRAPATPVVVMKPSETAHCASAGHGTVAAPCTGKQSLYTGLNSL